MSLQADLTGPIYPVAPRGRVLIVDDSRMQRSILRATLSRAGFDVVEAESGEAALALCAQEEIGLVVSDWLMPGMDGLEFCRAFRALPSASYGYFILLTSKAEKTEVAQGLDAGADDFLTKPVNAAELIARLSAGARILQMERRLTTQNRLLSATLGEVQALNQAIMRDLAEAAALQQSLVRERHRVFGRADVSLLLSQSGHVGGDLVGMFPISAHRVGLYAIDVSGHGIASAMMTARLAGRFMGATPGQNIALGEGPEGVVGRDPAEIAADLNLLLLQDMRSESYLTLFYGELCTASGALRYVQAGHPPGLLLRADGALEIIGEGGFPVGLVAEAQYETLTASLGAGDRLLIISDGAIEAEVAGEQIGPLGMGQLFAQTRAPPGPPFLEALHRRLLEQIIEPPGDDISAILVEFS